MKKLLAILLSAIMVIGACACLTACGGDDGIRITVWVSEVEGVKELTLQQIERFNETNEAGYKIVATVEGVSEADAATQVLTDVESAPDIYCYAQDQHMRLVKAGALAALGTQAAATVTANNDAGSVYAVTSGDKLYGYPLTSDNGYFMYYDKRVISEDIIDNFEDIVNACAQADKKFSFELTSSAWYIASFFFATGCKSTWTTDDDGNVTDFVDDFNSEKGLIALKGMKTLLDAKFQDGETDVLNSSSAGADFAAAVPSAVVISGTWASKVVTEALGDNMGVADLPSFTVDGTSYHLGSFSGNKLMGVKPQQDADKAAALQQLALYLTNEECQMERFTQFGWGPSNKNAQESDAVKADTILSALNAQNKYATTQGAIEGSWWEIGKALGVAAKDAKTEDDLKAALKVYEDALDDFKTDPKVYRIVGNFGTCNWDVVNNSIAFAQDDDDNWTCTENIEFKEGDEFKVVFKKGWNDEHNQIDPASATYAQSGEGSNNAKVLVAGTYTVKLNTKTHLITFVPVEA